MPDCRFVLVLSAILKIYLSSISCSDRVLKRLGRVNTNLKQGPRSNFWIEGAECLASKGRGEGWGNNRVSILASFFFNFFPFFNFFFLNYLAVATCSCLLLGFFRSLLVNIGKNICTVCYFDANPFASFCWMSECVFPKSQPQC